MPNTLNIYIALLITLSTSNVIWATDCRTDKIEQSTPSDRFTYAGLVVTDIETSLSWMRCAIGQAWNGKTCAGDPETFDWQGAMAAVENINAQNYGGYHDWRMPVMSELASIIERQCFNPRINTEVFPGAPSVIFWSAMEKMGNTSFAYTLDFGGGEAMATAKNEKGAVRLVRGVPSWQPSKMMVHK